MFGKLTLFALFFLSISAQAQIYEGAVASALAGSGRAGMDANDGVFLNPALVAILPKSEFDGYYKDGYVDRAQHEQAMGGSISEHEDDTPLPGQIGFIQTRNTGLVPEAANGQFWYGAIGKKFYDRFAVGISGYYLTEKPAGLPMSSQWNGSLGSWFMVIPDKLGVAYVYDNPLHPSSLVPQGLRQLPQQSIGLFYKTPYYARLRLDVLRQEEVNPGHRLNIHGSVETQFDPNFVFRLGARWDDVQDQRFITAGLAFDGPNLKIDYAIEKDLEHIGGAVHSVDIRTGF